jgi:hypothetical protein
MTTRAERDRFRAAIADNRLWGATAIVEAIIEDMEPVEARGWLTSIRRNVDDRLERLDLYGRADLPGAHPLECGACGRTFWAGLRARYCSSVCRQRAYRQRRPAIVKDAAESA